LHDLVLPRAAELAVKFEPDLLGGVSVITGSAERRQLEPWQDQLYRADLSSFESVIFKAIPYFA